MHHLCTPRNKAQTETIRDITMIGATTKAETHMYNPITRMLEGMLGVETNIIIIGVATDTTILIFLHLVSLLMRFWSLER